MIDLNESPHVERVQTGRAITRAYCDSTGVQWSEFDEIDQITDTIMSLLYYCASLEEPIDVMLSRCERHAIEEGLG